MSVYFAYDGSIHGDWISHYASRLASAHQVKTLHLVHVRERAPVPELSDKLERIRTECQRLAVDLDVQIKELAGSVLETILATVPSEADNYLVCGTRGRDRKRGLLSGSVSERLLQSRHCRTLAVRVVQPGLLGVPRQLLLPVSGRLRGFVAGLPFLKLLSQDLSELHLLHVQKVSRWRFRVLSHAAAERLHQLGQAHCTPIEEEIREALGLEGALIDSLVVVSEDVPKEIVIAANKTKSRLILLGASERNLTERFILGNPIEQVLRATTCDVAIYRGLK